MEKAATFDSKKMNMVITLILWTVLCVTCMVLMLYVALHKTIVIADEVPGQLALSVADGQGGIVGNSHVLTFTQQDGNEGSIRIPLAQDIKAENVVVENRYLNQELWVYIQGAEESFYDKNVIIGDVSPVVYGYCEEQRNGVILKIQMDDVWEYYSAMEYGTSVSDSGNSMVISFRDPHEIYGQVVVIDPMGGGSETGSLYRGYAEKTLALQIARIISEKLEQSDIRLYFTRLEDVEVAEETRSELAKAVNADMYIRIAAGADEDVLNYGVAGFYNAEYYIPEIGNVQLADILTRNVTIASSNRAVGIFPAAEDSILQRLTVPAAQINVGYLTNEQEAALLGREFYRDKLAQGIVDAIEEVYNSRKAELGDHE
ncbi:MAG: N-acetylmuramoyl-L-alanine amidase [Acetatifactor sp.]|nr:N-acetylmuramoyl-L-alanine amidase [Acetatifactor sp.]